MILMIVPALNRDHPCARKLDPECHADPFDRIRIYSVKHDTVLQAITSRHAVLKDLPNHRDVEGPREK